MHKSRLPAVAALALALAACTVGPDFVRPDVVVPEAFAQGYGASGESDQALRAPEPQVGERGIESNYWISFDDAVLTQLVEDALANNHDLRIALSRLDRADALLRNARFDALPTVTASGGGSDARLSGDEAQGGARDIDSYAVGINASWELDFFGRVRRGIEAEGAEADASASDLAAVQVAVVGELARTYFELRGLQERLDVAQRNADNQRETLRVVQARVDQGRGTEFDTSRTRAQLATTEARLPAIEALVAVAMHRIAVLSGRTPDALLAELGERQALPALPSLIDAGTPGELLRRRPDVAAAEHRLHASTARIGVATADLFPRFTLGGLVGSQSIDSSGLFDGGSGTRIVALGVDWSFLDVGRVRARIAASDADAAGELARYEQSVLAALEDTENALVRFGRARIEDGHLERAALDSANAARLARVRFDAGAIDLFEVLDAERTQLQAQDAFADARTRSVTGLVGVYRALAGGWPARMPERKRVASR